MAFFLCKAVPDEIDRLMCIDDASCHLYEDVGMHIGFGEAHPFVKAEAERWESAIRNGFGYVAYDERDTRVGFAIFCLLDGQPYLDQLSVHPDDMRQGVGARLLKAVMSWSGDRPLWLTTYANVPWNRPFYEKYGFTMVTETACGPELRATLDSQRAVLPSPEQRIAMVHHPSM